MKGRLAARCEAATRALGYDVENRLISAAPNVSLRYDPLGRLYEVSTGGGATTRFLYDGNALVAEYSGATLLRRYVHGTGADVPLVHYEGAGTAASDRRNLLADHQGSIAAVSNNAGTRLSINAYDEYGIPATTNSGRFQYTGQIWIAELGMYHYKARVYSPFLGRFLQVDPIGYEDQFNLYAYVGSDPVNSTDPTGTYKCKGSNPECDDVRRYARNLHRAARNAVAETGTRIRSHAAIALRMAAQHIGQENDGNGVTIQNDPSLERDLGVTDTDGNIRLDLPAINRAEAAGRASGAGVLGHEGSHSYILRAFGQPNSLRGVRTMERIGHWVQSYTDQYLGFSSDWWTPGMSHAQRRDTINWFSHRSCASYAENVQPMQFPGQSCLD